MNRQNTKTKWIISNIYPCVPRVRRTDTNDSWRVVYTLANNEIMIGEYYAPNESYQALAARLYDENPPYNYMAFIIRLGRLEGWVNI